MTANLAWGMPNQVRSIAIEEHDMRHPPVRECLTAMVGAAALLACTASFAADMTFFLSNERDQSVVLEVRSPQGTRSWPGGGKIWLLDPRAKKSVTIDCTAGETVCYAGWVQGDDRMSFGLGPDGGQCKNCCVICVDATTEAVTIPR